MIYKNENTDNINLCESAIMEILFHNTTPQVQFKINWTEGNPIIIGCENCTSWYIHFENKSDNNSDIGDLEISSFSYKPIENNWILQFNFNFNPKGCIQVICSEFYFDVPSRPLSEGGNDNDINQIFMTDFGNSIAVKDDDFMLYKLQYTPQMWETNLYFQNKDKTKVLALTCKECYNHNYKIKSFNNSLFSIKESSLIDILKSFALSNEIILISKQEDRISLQCTNIVLNESYETC